MEDYCEQKRKTNNQSLRCCYAGRLTGIYFSCLCKIGGKMEYVEMIRNLLISIAMIAVVVFGKKYFNKEDLKEILDMLKTLINDVEVRRGPGNGEKKFAEVKEIAENLLTNKQKQIIKKSVW